MMVVIFLLTDFIDGLVDGAAIRRKKESYFHLLFKYLKLKVGSASGTGGGGTRELREIEDKRLRI